MAREALLPEYQVDRQRIGCLTASPEILLIFDLSLQRLFNPIVDRTNKYYRGCASRMKHSWMEGKDFIQATYKYLT
jgi:hypothetical protein